MATYNYKCSKCENIFDLAATLQEKEAGGEKFVCPKCGSKEIKQQYHAVNFIKNIFVSENKGGCCGGGDVCDISCKPDKNNPDGCGDQKGGSGCCG